MNPGPRVRTNTGPVVAVKETITVSCIRDAVTGATSTVPAPAVNTTLLSDGGYPKPLPLKVIVERRAARAGDTEVNFRGPKGLGGV